MFFVITQDGKQKAMGYFCSQVEAEIYAADFNKKNHKILHGHETTFSELFYRWLPFYIDKHQPSKSTNKQLTIIHTNIVFPCMKCH